MGRAIFYCPICKRILLGVSREGGQAAELIRGGGCGTCAKAVVSPGGEMFRARSLRRRNRGFAAPG